MIKRRSLWSKSFFAFLCVGFIIAFIVTACGPKAPARESIRIGFSTSLTGIYAAASDSKLNAITLWSEQVNAKGGIYVKDIGRNLPVKLVYYDDKSSTEECIRIYERLITVEKVDLLFSPWGTTLNMALVPTVEKYKAPLIGTTTCALKLKGLDIKYYWSVTKDRADTQMPALVGLLNAQRDKINKVAVLYINDVYPMTNESYLMPLLKEKGFDVVVHKDYPLGVTDLSGVLLEIKGKNPDAVLGLSYPADYFLMQKQAMEIGLNPKFFYGLIGPGCDAFPSIFGPATEGVCFQASWNQKDPYPGAKEFNDSYVKRWNKAPDYLDSAETYEGLQILQKTIEDAGTLDWQKIRDVIATEVFKTINGEVYWGGTVFNQRGPSGVSQWQKGTVECIWPPEIATAKPEIPKPAWPK